MTILKIWLAKFWEHGILIYMKINKEKSTKSGKKPTYVLFILHTYIYHIILSFLNSASVSFSSPWFLNLYWFICKINIESRVTVSICLCVGVYVWMWLCRCTYMCLYVYVYIRIHILWKANYCLWSEKLYFLNLFILQEASFLLYSVDSLYTAG